jgi:uncharacterized protein (TIGR02271 family)
MASDPVSSGETVVSLLTEDISVAKQKVETGRVKVSTVTHEHAELVDELLAREHVEIEHKPIGKPIEAIPAVREEGDTTIIPIVEEVLFIERRLFLKEEVLVRRVHETERYQERVMLRRQEAVVTHVPVETPGVRAGSAAEVELEESRAGLQGNEKEK